MRRIYTMSSAVLIASHRRFRCFRIYSAVNASHQSILFGRFEIRTVPERRCFCCVTPLPDVYNIPRSAVC